MLQGIDPEQHPLYMDHVGLPSGARVPFQRDDMKMMVKSRVKLSLMSGNEINGTLMHVDNDWNMLLGNYTNLYRSLINGETVEAMVKSPVALIQYDDVSSVDIVRAPRNDFDFHVCLLTHINRHRTHNKKSPRQIIYMKKYFRTRF